MLDNYSFTVAERFMRYVQTDTQSDPKSDAQPSTEKQKNLSRILVQELLDMGIADAHLDEYGYVYATIPANTDKDVPVICFCAHVDTAPDCSGTNVKPILHKNYQGQDIILPDNPTQVLNPVTQPYLGQLTGNDIITASGLTLLGADDKAGVAEIMDLAHYLTSHPEVKHGTLKLLFTPDEEVGRGADKVNIEKLGARFGYTLDGGPAGSLEDETFSADGIEIIINGIIAHPGYAKGKLVNALKIAGHVINSLPKNELSPETTDKKQGFIHPTRISGIAEKCTLEFIIRDFNTPGLQEKEALLQNITAEVVGKYNGATFEFKVREQYRNMKEVLDRHPEIIENARKAIERTGLAVITKSIRGGTDGSRLSFMGLPCPNLYTGMQAIHSLQEYVSVQDMEKAVTTLVHLVGIWEENT